MCILVQFVWMQMYEGCVVSPLPPPYFCKAAIVRNQHLALKPGILYQPRKPSVDQSISILKLMWLHMSPSKTHLTSILSLCGWSRYKPLFSLRSPPSLQTQSGENTSKLQHPFGAANTPSKEMLKRADQHRKSWLLVSWLIHTCRLLTPGQR